MIKTINYIEYFERMSKEHENLEQEFYKFKVNPNNKTKEELLNKLKSYSASVSKFRTSVKNLYIGGANE